MEVRSGLLALHVFRYVGSPGGLSNGHNFRGFFHFLICYVKASTLSNERKNKWALPSGAKEQIGPTWRK